MNEQANFQQNEPLGLSLENSENFLNTPSFGVNVHTSLEKGYNLQRKKIDTETINEVTRLLPEIRLKLYHTSGEINEQLLDGVTESDRIHLADPNSENVITFADFQYGQEILGGFLQREESGETLSGTESFIKNSIIFWLENGDVIGEEQNLIREAVGNYTSRDEAYQLDPEKEYNFEEASPVTYIIEKYKDASEEKKLLLIQTLGEGLGREYDFAIMNDPDQQGVGSEEMWNRLKNGDDVGICGDIHKEMLRLAQGLGFDGEIISVNARDVIHLTMRGVKENGKHFMFDYGQYFEADSAEELIDFYHIRNKTMSTQSYVGNADGDVTSIQQTEMQKRTGEIIYIDRDIAFDTKDGVDVEVTSSSEFRLQYSKTFGEIQAKTYLERYAPYGIEQDFAGISIAHSSDSKEYGAQYGYAKYQDANSVSGFFTKKQQVGDTSLEASISGRATFNSGGGIGDIGMDIGASAEKNGFRLGVDGIVVSADLGVNKPSFSNARIIPTLSLKYTSPLDASGRSFSGGIEISEIEKMLEVGTKRGTSEINLKLTSTENNLSGKSNEEIVIRNSWIFSESGELYGEIKSSGGDVSSEVGVKYTFGKTD